MKIFNVLVLLVFGVLIFAVVRAFSNRSGQWAGTSPYPPNYGGNSAGSIVQAISSSFLSLFKGGVFGTGWGKDTGTNSTQPTNDFAPDSWVTT